MANTLINTVLLESTNYNQGVVKFAVNYNDGSDDQFKTVKYDDLSAGEKTDYDNAVTLGNSKLPVDANTYDMDSICILEDQSSMLIHYCRTDEGFREKQTPIRVEYSALSAGEKTDFDAMRTMAATKM